VLAAQPEPEPEPEPARDQIPCLITSVSHSTRDASSPCTGVVGDDCEYICDRGWIDRGDGHLLCSESNVGGVAFYGFTSSGNDPPATLCAPNPCDPMIIDNSNVTHSTPCRGRTGQTCAYQCNPGYVDHGTGYVVCGVDGNLRSPSDLSGSELCHIDHTIYGCTDSLARNYCDHCNSDDASCVYDGPTFVGRSSVRKTASFLEFSLCLSRACLGKMMHFIYKWLKNAVFRRATQRSVGGCHRSYTPSSRKVR
jgi:hypothetical protein